MVHKKKKLSDNGLRVKVFESGYSGLDKKAMKKFVKTNKIVNMGAGSNHITFLYKEKKGK